MSGRLAYGNREEEGPFPLQEPQERHESSGGGGLDEPASGYHVRSATLQLAFENVQAFTNAPTKRGAITDVDNANQVST